MKTRILLMLMLALVGLSGRGQVTFQKTYYADSGQQAYSVRQTIDSGYILTGLTTLGAGHQNIILIRTNSFGDTLWTKVFGGTNYDNGFSAQQTIDGGFIVLGATQSFGAGGWDVYLIKTDSLGNIIFSKTYGGTSDDIGYSIQQTRDSGYIITGYTNSYGAGGTDVYLIKINNIGDTLWTKTYGGIGAEQGNLVQQTNDGGYIIVGSSNEFSTTFNNVYLIKTDSIGNLLWSKVYGITPNFSYGNYVQQTSDNGYIITGCTYYYTNNLNDDVYLIRTDSVGDTLWTKTYGGSSDDKGYYVEQDSNGDFVITGMTASFGAGGYDFYLIKTNANGDTLLTKTYGTSSYDVSLCGQQTFDGGFILAGLSDFDISIGGAIYLVKTDHNGNVGCNEFNTSTVTNGVPTIETNAATLVHSGAIISSPITIVNHGSNVSNPCTTGINEIRNKENSILLSPNPFTTQATLTFQGSYHHPSLYIYNLLGEIVQTYSNVSLPQITIERNNLPAGMYFYKVIEENKEVLGIGKMLVE